jgi:Fe-Mn family superoxide dismutase
MKINEKLLERVVNEALEDFIPSKSPKKLEEAYVVQSKKFDVKTDSLSEASRKAHQELLDGYVKALNEVSAKLDTADREGANPNNSEFRNLKLDEVHNINASFLHGLFFDNIGSPSTRVTVDSIAYMRLARDWGDFNKWQKDFIACGMSSRNGWVVTCYNTLLKRYLNVVVDLHSGGIPFGSIPIIVVDCWEHSYYSDFLKDRKAYIYAMMRELNWNKIEERIEKAERISKVMAS